MGYKTFEFWVTNSKPPQVRRDQKLELKKSSWWLGKIKFGDIKLNTKEPTLQHQPLKLALTVSLVGNLSREANDRTNIRTKQLLSCLEVILPNQD